MSVEPRTLLGMLTPCSLRYSGDGPRQVHHTDFRLGTRDTRLRCGLDGDTLALAPVFAIVPLQQSGTSLHVGGRMWRGVRSQAYEELRVPLGSFVVAIGDLRHAGAACVAGQQALRLHVSIVPSWLCAIEGKLESSFTVLSDSE